MGTAATSLAAGSAMPTSREPGTPRPGRLGTVDGGPCIPPSTGGTGAKQVWCGVTARSPARRGTAGRDPAPQMAGLAGGRPGPARDEAFNQVSARRAGPVTRLPPARPRPAAMCQPVTVVRMAGMTIAVVPAGSAACPALPWQVSIERPAESKWLANVLPEGVIRCTSARSVRRGGQSAEVMRTPSSRCADRRVPLQPVGPETPRQAVDSLALLGICGLIGGNPWHRRHARHEPDLVRATPGPARPASCCGCARTALRGMDGVRACAPARENGGS
jgi:hypothetical protein